jgi:hypothetical protein
VFAKHNQDHLGVVFGTKQQIFFGRSWSCASMEQQGLVFVLCGHRITKPSLVIAKVNLGDV